MVVGHTLLVETLSCPAPDERSRTISPVSSPNMSAEASLTHLMQSGWNTVASVSLSVCHVIWKRFRLGVPPVCRPVTFFPLANLAKSRFSSASMTFTVSFLGERTSRLKRTLPGMVFVEPGRAVMMPVETSAECLVATLCDCTINLLARRRASLRLASGVVPV